MNSAEYKTIRRLLGITVDEVVARFQVPMRSVRRWESTHTPPKGVAEWLEQKLERAHILVENLLEANQAHDEPFDATIYRTDDDAQSVLGHDMSKEQHTAIVGLALFLSEHAKYSQDTAEKQQPLGVQFAEPDK